MGFDLLLALLVAYYMTRNTVQDMAWKARGEDPPSYRRERERWERKQAKRAAGPGPGRKLFANAWADAVASADERRARTAAKSAQKRRAKWAEQDTAAAEDEAYAINERLTAADNAPNTTDDDLDGPTSDTGTFVQDEVLWACQQCGRQMRNAGEDGYSRDERVCRYCRTGDPLPDRPCHFCGAVTPAGELWPTRNLGTTVDACQPCWDDHNRALNSAQDDAVTQCAGCGDDVRLRDTTVITVDGARLLLCPPCRLRRADGDPDETPTEDSDDDPTAEVIQFADWQRPAASPTEKENELSAEITGLQSAIAFTEGSAAAAEHAATQVELAISNLQAGGTTGNAITALRSAMESHQITASLYRTAAGELTSQLQVKEAYEANKGAGTKQFVTSE